MSVHCGKRNAFGCNICTDRTAILELCSDEDATFLIVGRRLLDLPPAQVGGSLHVGSNPVAHQQQANADTYSLPATLEHRTSGGSWVALLKLDEYSGNELHKR